jgi:very-short-patch-repair endonuclease
MGEQGAAADGASAGDPDAPGPHVLEQSLETSLAGIDPRVRGRVMEWARRLIDLSRRNRLLAYRPFKRTTLEFQFPAPDAIATQLIGGNRWSFYEPPRKNPQSGSPEVAEALAAKPSRPTELVTTQRNPDELTRSLDAISRRSKAEFEDRGIHSLHLIWSLVRWPEPGTEDEWVAPLVMVPVTLSRESVRDVYRLQRTEDDAVINPALRVKLENDFGIQIPEFDVEDTPILEIGRTVSNLLAKAVPKSHVDPYAGLGLFTFHKEAIYRDLVTNADVIADHAAVQSLALGTIVPALFPTISVDLPSESDLDRVQEPGQSFSVLDADSSQRIAIEAAVRGQSHVIHGPPGTGKSQTIANMIAELVGRGKSVLFVSEKAAALEVVAQRLHEVELGDLLLELHSHKAKRQEVARELGRSLEEAVVASDRDFDREASRVGPLRQGLNEYADALHAPVAPLGRSLFEVLAELSALDNAPALPAPTLELAAASPDAFDGLLSRVDAVAAAWDPVEMDEFPWRGARKLDWSPAKRQEVLQWLDDAQTNLEVLESVESELATAVETSLPRNESDRRRLLAIGDSVRDRRSVPIAWLTTDELLPLSDLIERWEAVVRQREVSVAQLTTRFGDRWREVDPAESARLRALHDELTSIAGQSIGSFTKSDLEGIRLQGIALEAEAGRLAGLTAQLRELVGVGGGDSLAEVERLVAVGRLTQRRNRPLARWLSRGRLDELSQFIATHGHAFERAQRSTADLSTRYDAEFFEIDFEPVIERMTRFHGKPWNLVRPSYRADRTLLSRLSRRRRLEPGVMEDLEEAVYLRNLKAWLDRLTYEAADLLGQYGQGWRTDIVAIQEAIGIARTVLDLPHASTDWDVVIARASAESAYEPAIDRVADQAERVLSACSEAFAAAGANASPSVIQSLRIAAADQLAATARKMREAAKGLLEVFERLDTHRLLPVPNAELALQDVELRQTVATVDAQLIESEGVLQAALHDRYAGLETQWSDLRLGLAWARQLRQAYQGRTLSEGLAQRVLRGDLDISAWEEYAAAIARASSTNAQVASLFESEPASAVLARLDGTAADAAVVASELVQRVDDLDTWNRFLDASQAMSAVGWREWLDAAVKARLRRGDLGRSARRAWLDAWARSAIAADPRLADFSREKHDRAVESFRLSDRQTIKLSREKVLARYEAGKPEDILLLGGEVAIVRREAVKKRRHLSVRQLLASTPTLLPRLKPCLMMSPLSVSHFLSPKMRFDVVVFDEASQVPPENAINCVYRSNQLIVAGDPKQLPPTDFFQLAAADSGESELDTQVDDFESILDLAQASNYPTHPLRWHYRSRHDSLIAFSNRYIYGDSLVTFPPPNRDGEELGVRFVHVPDGVFDRGRTAKNSVEARKVVEVAAAEVRASDTASIGIVAFSVAQQEAIEDEWEKLLRRDADLERRSAGDRLQGLFIKNLETVQGDERDVIIFSIGYGRDETGRLLMNFGPLNRAGGPRRLNVAVTRARRRVIVVSSIRAEDFPGVASAEGRNDGSYGPALLRAYLDYAEHGVLPSASSPGNLRGSFESEFERQVAEVVRGLGYEVTPQVGVSTYRVDLGVVSRVNPARYTLGIECDGAMYHSARTARDRDRLRQSVLEGLGWQIHRVWSQDWFAHRARAVDRLRRAIEEAESSQQRVAAKNVVRPPGPELQAEQEPSEQPRRRYERAVVDLADSTQVSDLRWTRPYAVAQIKPYRSTWLEFHDFSLNAEHSKRLTDLVIGEGPVHLEYVAARLARAFGIQRVGNRVLTSVVWAAEDAKSRGQIEIRGEFLWPKGYEFAYVRVPTDDAAAMRHITMIPPAELDLALLRLTETAVRISTDDLLTAVSRVFGFRRLGGDIRSALEARLRALQTNNALAVVANEVTLSAALPALEPRKLSPAAPVVRPQMSTPTATRAPIPPKQTSPNAPRASTMQSALDGAVAEALALGPTGLIRLANAWKDDEETESFRKVLLRQLIESGVSMSELEMGQHVTSQMPQAPAAARGAVVDLAIVRYLGHAADPAAIERLARPMALAKDSSRSTLSARDPDMCPHGNRVGECPYVVCPGHFTGGFGMESN